MNEGHAMPITHKSSELKGWRLIFNHNFLKKSVMKKFNTLSTPSFLSLCFLITSIVSFIDFKLGYEMGFSFFYLIPIIMISWKFGLFFSFIFSSLAAILWGALDVMSGHVYSQAYMIPWNISSRFLIFLMVSYLVFLLKQAILEETHNANTDFLTGAMNLRHITQLINLEVERMKRGGPRFTIIYLDVDEFKKINDCYGHKRGDQLLKKITAIFKNNLREIDVVSRIGGDEFILFFPNTEKEISTIFKRIQADLSKYTRPRAKISAGILTCKSTNISTARLIKKADKLMFKAKKHGGGQAEYQRV